MHRWSWISNDGRTEQELHYIIVSARWNILQNYRVYRSPGCGNNTDHRLIAATCSLRPKRCSLPQLRYFTAHCRREAYRSYHTTTLRTQAPQPVRTSICNKVPARRLATKRKQQLRRDETVWYSRIAERQNTRFALETVQCSTVPSAHSQVGLHTSYHMWLPKTGHHSAMKRTNSTDGKTLSKNSSTINPAPPLDHVLMTEAASATPDPSIESTPPTVDEISAAIRQPNNNNNIGRNGSCF